MAKAIIYLRVSSSGQAHKENPISAQKSACLEYAEKRGYTDIDEKQDIYIDGGISAFKGRADDRFAFKEMTNRLEQDDGVEAVIAYDMSRIFRNGIEYFKYKKGLEKHGKKFLSVTEPFKGDGSSTEFIVEWTLAGINQFRSMQDGEKISNGMKEKSRNGWLANKAPFGYKNVQEKTSSTKAK